MGTESVTTGKIGEAQARNLLLPYFTIAEPVPDQGIDFVAEVRESRGDPFTFAVQAKLAKEFTVPTGTLFRWIDRVGIQPVMLLHVERLSSESQRYRFRVLYDWMMANPEWERFRRQNEMTFNLAVNGQWLYKTRQIVTGRNKHPARWMLWRPNRRAQIPSALRSAKPIRWRIR